MGYHIADANSYLVITGGGIEDVQIVKKAWVYPWQKFSYISISPFDFEITLQAMTVEKLQLLLPAVFTIGPDDEPKALRRYAMILTDQKSMPKKVKLPTKSDRTHVQEIVKGIIEGETRVIVSGMTMEEIFKERQVFKDHVIMNVQSELNQFGLKIYNANVKGKAPFPSQTHPHPLLNHHADTQQQQSSKTPPDPSTSNSSRAKPTKAPPTKPKST